MKTGIINNSNKSKKIPSNPFPAGNKLWEKRKRTGKKPKFSNPDDLWDSCCRYFDWAHENPLYKEVIHMHKGKAIRIKIAKMRAFSLNGLTLFLGIDVRTWAKWRVGRPDLRPVITWAEMVVYEQQFTGAAAGLLKPCIIARQLPRWRRP